MCDAHFSYPNRTITTENLPDGRKITHITVQAIDVPVYPSRKVCKIVVRVTAKSQLMTSY